MNFTHQNEDKKLIFFSPWENEKHYQEQISEQTTYFARYSTSQKKHEFPIVQQQEPEPIRFQDELNISTNENSSIKIQFKKIKPPNQESIFNHGLQTPSLSQLNRKFSELGPLHLKQNDEQTNNSTNSKIMYNTQRLNTKSISIRTPLSDSKLPSNFQFSLFNERIKRKYLLPLLHSNNNSKQNIKFKRLSDFETSQQENQQNNNLSSINSTHRSSLKQQHHNMKKNSLELGSEQHVDLNARKKSLPTQFQLEKSHFALLSPVQKQKPRPPSLFMQKLISKQKSFQQHFSTSCTSLCTKDSQYNPLTIQYAQNQARFSVFQLNKMQRANETEQFGKKDPHWYKASQIFQTMYQQIKDKKVKNLKAQSQQILNVVDNIGSELEFKTSLQTQQKDLFLDKKLNSQLNTDRSSNKLLKLNNFESPFSNFSMSQFQFAIPPSTVKDKIILQKHIHRQSITTSVNPKINLSKNCQLKHQKSQQQKNINFYIPNK